MPSSDEYLQGYDLYSGLLLAGYKLVEVTAQHSQVVLFNEYEYPTTLVFQPEGNEDLPALLAAVQDHTSGIRIIYSQSGRPYKCLFQWPVDSEPITEVVGEQVLLHFHGYAKRIGKKEVEALQSGRQSGWERDN